MSDVVIEMIGELQIGTHGTMISTSTEYVSYVYSPSVIKFYFKFQFEVSKLYYLFYIIIELGSYISIYQLRSQGGGLGLWATTIEI